MKRRPNILFLMSDEHRADIAGFAGNAIIRTPVLDRLAQSGVVFRSAYTPSPICIPGRQCLMAGQLPKTCGCEGWFDLPPNHMTWARRLAQYGYQTVACGKLHHIGPDQMQGWRMRVGMDIQMDARHLEGRVEAELARYAPPVAHKWTQAREVQRAGVGRAPHVGRDDYAVQGALRVIEEHFLNAFYDRATPDTPLLLKVSLNQPHYPYITDSQEKFEHYLNRVPLTRNAEVFDHPFLGGDFKVRVGQEVSAREMRRAIAAYYAMIETLDAQFGTVLDALRHAGEDLDEWIIIYTSDHGEMLGEHGVFEKQKFFEESVRVPLFIRWPQRFAPCVVEENVNLCDLFATLCEACEIPTPSGLDSRSLTSLMRGDAVNWNNESVSQFGPRNLMIKRDHVKYQFYGPDSPEVLFDLERDAGETRNFINEPQYAAAIASFRERLGELGHGPNADRDYLHAGYDASKQELS